MSGSRYPVPAGAPVGEHLLERATDGLGPLMRRGERAAEVVARGSPDLITPGARVDVVVTRERRDSQLALENVEVLSARPVTEEGTGPQVAATLRVTVRQAVYLAAAATFAAEIRLLARPPGDDRRAGAAVVGSDLSVLQAGTSSSWRGSTAVGAAQGGGDAGELRLGGEAAERAARRAAGAVASCSL